MADRFFHPGPWAGDCELTGTEAHHLLHVLRAKPGLEVELFDGCGRSARAHVASVSRQSARMSVDEIHPLIPSTLPEIMLAVASPKGDRLKWMVEKLTEIGVDRLIPLTTARSVVSPSDVKLHKLEQTIISACKQCGRNRLLQVEDLCPLAALADRFGASRPRLLYGRCTGGMSVAQALVAESSTASILVVIGPEGGLTDEELSLLDSQGAVPISLGTHILRVETAAIVAGAAAGEFRMGKPH